jgi:hypothetical protein
MSLWNAFKIALCDSVVFSVVQKVLWTFDVYCTYSSAHTSLILIILSLPVYYIMLSSARFGWGQVRLGWKYSRQDLFRFFILFYRRRMRTYKHTAFTVLDRYMLRRTQKRRQRRFKVSASIFRLIWISLLHNVAKRVRNRTSRFRCVFGGTDGYEVWKNWVIVWASPPRPERLSGPPSLLPNGYQGLFPWE